ncbi:MAG: hypothetical protein SFX73_35210 [Kofleriaceae bacterium]|nr:hypothetical protein [Kofleriaceae bacterium]
MLRLALIASLFGACMPTPEARQQRYPQAVGPELGESTAMGPSDSTRMASRGLSPSGVPLNVGPGKPITPPGPGAPAPTQAPAVIQEQPILVVPLGGEPPPPVFTPPPPQPPPSLADRVMADGPYED